MADRWGQFLKDGAPQLEADPWGQFVKPDATIGDAPVGALEDTAKSFGSGVATGVLGLGTMPGNLEVLINQHGLPWVLEKFGRGKEAKELREAPRQMGPTVLDAQSAVEEYTGPFHKPQTRSGEIAKTVGEFAPGAAFPGGAVQRIGMNVLAPAAGYEAAGELAKGTQYETPAKVAGAIVAPTAARGAMRAVTPFPATPHRTQQAAVMDAEDVSMTAGQRTGNKALHYTESTLGDYPLAGNRATAAAERQAEDFTAAMLRRAGTDARRATTDVIDDTFTRIGSVYDNIGQNNTFIPRQRTVHDVAGAIADYERLVAPAYQSNAVPRTMEAIRDVTIRGAGYVDGPVFLKLRSDISRDARRLHRNDPAAAEALLDVREALDATFLSGLNQAEAAAWREANNQYRNLMVVERAAQHAKGGLLTPAQMRIGLVGQDGRGYVRGTGDYNDIVHAADEIMVPLPQSGTTPRAIAAGVASGIAGAAGAAAGGSATAGATAAAGTLAPALGGRAIMSPPAQAYLGNQAAAPILGDMGKSRAFVADAPSTAAIAVETFEEALRLKKGTRFTDPFGVERVR